MINDDIDDQFLKNIYILKYYSAFERKFTVEFEFLNTNEEYHTKRSQNTKKGTEILQTLVTESYGSEDSRTTCSEW